jgi:hypothetical protein
MCAGLWKFFLPKRPRKHRLVTHFGKRKSQNGNPLECAFCAVSRVREQPITRNRSRLGSATGREEIVSRRASTAARESACTTANADLLSTSYRGENNVSTIVSAARASVRAPLREHTDHRTPPSTENPLEVPKLSTFKDQEIYRAPFSQFLGPSPGATIRLICPATARDRFCTDGHPTLAGPLKDYLEILYLAGSVLRWQST